MNTKIPKVRYDPETNRIIGWLEFERWASFNCVEWHRTQEAMKGLPLTTESKLKVIVSVMTMHSEIYKDMILVYAKTYGVLPQPVQSNPTTAKEKE